MNILADLEWRYATKKYDTSKKISDADFQILLEALRLTPTSYGFQPYHFLVVENPEIREKLKQFSWNQAQITDASHLIILCTDIDCTEVHIDSLLEKTAKTRDISAIALKPYGDFMRGILKDMSANDRMEWNSKQAYIALGFLLQTAAHLKIDATPMEGFNAKGYDKVLNLSQKGLKATIACPLGYRSEMDATQHLKKIRKDALELFTYI